MKVVTDIHSLRQPSNWFISQDRKPQSDLQPSTWVQLLELPSLFSFGEALLLCQQSEDQWLAWVPDHGEVVLHVSQFCTTESY